MKEEEEEKEEKEKKKKLLLVFDGVELVEEYTGKKETFER